MTTLVADVGGTFTRFALAEGEAIGEVSVVESGTYARFADAAEDFLKLSGGRPRRAAIAVAGPVAGGRVTMTNGPQWEIDSEAVRQALGLERVLLVNDFAAVAASAPRLPPEGLVEIAPGVAEADGAIAVIGPGTGLGVALLAPDGRGGHRVMPGEGGHAALAATNEREIAVIFQLIRRFGHVKAEFVLSGTGLEILWETLAGLDGVEIGGKPTAGEIAERARRKADPVAVETVEMMTGWLGGFTGDVALIAGATGGVYLAGGVLPRWGALFDTRLFRRRFTAKGSHREILERTPIRLIVDKQPAFKGLLALLGDAA